MTQGIPSTLAPAGQGAHLIAPLAWLLIVVATIVCLVVAALVVAGARRRGTITEHAAVDTGGGTGWIQFGGLLIPLIVLAATFVLSEHTLGLLPRAHAAERATPVTAAAADTGMTIDVTGRQWWWQIRYGGSGTTGGGGFTTANELHVPVGRPVHVRLHSSDVNHSFWIPQLSPKEDMIPGRVNTLTLQAERPGTYRGECSEFCGDEHARMVFTVVADSPEQFAAWMARESAAAAAPADSLAERGRRAFLANACAFCHTVRGTTAQGIVAPDLTHVASRPTLAAGTLPNTRPMLEGWIMNAPAIKPGTQMPAFPQLDSSTLRALVAYLETLR